MDSRLVPRQLADGIALEDAGLLIRWGTPIVELEGFKSPTVTRHPGSISLCWENRTCFGGLPCDVGAIRIFEAPNPQAYHIYLAEFHWSSIKVRQEWCQAPGEIEAGFRRLYRHLERELGPPTFSYPAYEQGLPSIHWELQRLKIGYSLLGGQPHISVAHEPDGYAALKAEARAIRMREGEGAWVDYVAWPGEQEIADGEL